MRWKDGKSARLQQDAQILFDMGSCFGCQAENLKEVFATSPCVKRLKDMVFMKVGIFSAEKKQDLQSLKQHPIKYESYPIPNSDCCNCKWHGLGAWSEKAVPC